MGQGALSTLAVGGTRISGVVACGHRRRKGRPAMRPTSLTPQPDFYQKVLPLRPPRPRPLSFRPRTFCASSPPCAPSLRAESAIARLAGVLARRRFFSVELVTMPEPDATFYFYFFPVRSVPSSYRGASVAAPGAPSVASRCNGRNAFLPLVPCLTKIRGHNVI